MKLTQREINLGLITLGVVLLGFAFSLCSDQLESWRDARKEETLLSHKKIKMERLYAQREVLDGRLKGLLQTLPAYPLAKDVTSDSLRKVQNLASKSELQLRSLDPSKERQVGDSDIYELAITCNWQGSLESLVKFLHSLRLDGAQLDIRQINMAPLPRQIGMLKGSFVVDCAYSRQDLTPSESQRAATNPGPEV